MYPSVLYSQMLTVARVVFAESQEDVGRAGMMTLWDVLRMDITSCSASVWGEVGEGAEEEVEDVDANAVSMRVIWEMSRMVMNLEV